jgi:DNA-binding GntR family transcriptional regulator
LSKRQNETFELPKTIAETIYLYLKKQIVNGDLVPNQRITEKEITNLFNVSSTPVREAIYRLCAEKYLKKSDRKSVLVQSLSYEEVGDLYEAIRVLDSYVFIKCILIISDKELEELKELTNKLCKYYENNDAKNFVLTNLRIHDRIWERCENKYIFETLHQLVEKVKIFLVREDYEPYKNPSKLRKSCEDHLKIMKAIEERDIKILEKIMQNHWGQELFDKNRRD